ncbi:alpha/beta hydrolase [Variovorax sp. J22R133]|uniref:alpha/beta hydrolase n=1 Tax=Variovorax brevis TaxID=3053503 RepID=UPI002578E8B3|nr:alpha/beta hydrolase [Variovorax sp. J22R133]MDM0111139.1 alpha/beta hydrolase [Variovorax sp. J22R133]
MQVELQVGVLGWIKRKVFNTLLRWLVKPLWLRKGLTVDFVRKRLDMFCSWLPAATSAPGRPDRVSPDCDGEWIEPTGRTPQRLVLYLHGGAWITRAPQMYRAFARRLAEQLDARVFLPDYRLAPEHRFPAGADDALAAYRHVLAQGVSPGHLVIAGDSAGGNLTLVTLQRARDEGLPLPACAFVLSPVADLSFGSPSAHLNAESDVMFSGAATGFVLGNYLNDPAEAEHPHASPLKGTFHDLPPLLLQASTTELLRDDSLRFAEGVQAAGGRAECTLWPDLPHVFQIADFLEESKVAMSQIASFVKRECSAPVS